MAPNKHLPTRYSRRSVLRGGLAGIGIASTGSLLWGCGGDSPQPAPTGTASPGNTPATPAPTATPGAIDASAFDRVEAVPTKTWRRLNYRSGDTISEAHGIFFMSAADGSVVGWQLLHDDGPPYHPSYVAPHGNRMVIAATLDHDVLFHREYGTSVRWPKRYLAYVGAFEDIFVLQERIPVSSKGEYGQPTENLIVCSAAGDHFRPIATFTLPGAPDAARSTVLALAGDRLLLHFIDYPQPPQALVVDLSSGSVESLLAEPDPYIESVDIAPDGSIVVTFGSGFGTDAQGWGAVALGPDGAAQDTFGPHPSSRSPLLSRDSHFAATSSYLRVSQNVLDAIDAPGESWPEVTLWSVERDEPLFRVRSATFSGGDFLSGPRWLADSSGFLVYTGAGPGEQGVRTALVTLDGGGEPSIEYLPHRPLVASPGNPDLFAASHSSIWNRHTGDLFEVGANLGFSDFFSPWNGRSDEIVCVVPHGGHGGYQVGTLLAPAIERPPLGDAMHFAVTGSETCLNLRSAPGLAADILMCIPEGAVLELDVPNTPPHSDPDNRQPDEPFEGLATHRNGEDGEEFVHVREPSGANGWVSTTYLTWAIK
jgi:hypothetical protein